MRQYRILRPLLTLAAMAAMMLAMQATAGANAGLLVGLWQSQGPDTRGMTEYAIQPDGSYSALYQDGLMSTREAGTWHVGDGVVRFDIGDWDAAPYGTAVPADDVFAVEFDGIDHVILTVPGCHGQDQGCHLDLVRVQ